MGIHHRGRRGHRVGRGRLRLGRFNGTCWEKENNRWWGLRPGKLGRSSAAPVHERGGRACGTSEQYEGKRKRPARFLRADPFIHEIGCGLIRRGLVQSWLRRGGGCGGRGWSG